ncbi:MAG TPA: alpha-glucan family phosphorylase [Pyrinomonadaceae bacterium]|nr:alpha-glucan family phosphorylase [Pyrinomonadaceae bacterium]
MVETTEIEKRVRENSFPALLLPLARLAWNYWWSWAPDGISIFRDLDPELWEDCEQNPRQLLARTAPYRLAEAATDPAYIERVQRLLTLFEAYMSAAAASSLSITTEHPVAYFCAEFGIHNSLPLYSGGLGILAGDHLKSASDLNLPLIAVGLLYRYGYFRQRLRNDGWQEEHYGETYPNNLPLTLVNDNDGKPLQIQVLIRERNVLAQVWRADVGRVKLYLLDTNLPENDETDRWVTGHLYGGDRETRIVQEMLLGIGGVRLLRRLGVKPHVFHLNEGHSAFLTIELAREVIQFESRTWDEAVEIVRRQCVFTTHTPVAAGNDEFDAALVARVFGPTYARDLRLTDDQFLGLGRVEPNNNTERFGLTPLAIRMCRSTNGVSRKHGEVSRALWQKLWPEKSLAEVPITYVTNGVHVPTWVSPMLRWLFEKNIGSDWDAKLRDAKAWKDAVAAIPDEELWFVHSQLKERLVAFIQARSPQTPKLDPEALTIGFARRVAGYKRWVLLLSDRARLLRLMNAESRPVQFIFAGKAHPQDEGSKRVLQQLAQWKQDPVVNGRAVFLEDYDQEIARQLVQAVDVWLNVPRRPQEASGTSGQKVGINGGLNLSILDGWWLEGYDTANGFAVGNGIETADTTQIDAADAESLYRTLEDMVVPLYYHREGELPRQWIAMMKRAIQTLAPQFNSNRMVEQYAREIYP